MASKSYKNIISALAITDASLSLMLEQDNRERTLSGESRWQISEGLMHIKKAYTLWTEKLNDKDIMEIDFRIKKWTAACFPKKQENTVVLICISILIFDDLLDRLKDSAKIKTIESLLTCLRTLFETLSINDNEYDLYEDAERKTELWWKLSGTKSTFRKNSL